MAFCFWFRNGIVPTFGEWITTNKNSYSRDEVDLLISSNIEDTEEISELMKSLENRTLITQKEIRVWQRENKLKVEVNGTKVLLKSIVDRITISNQEIVVHLRFNQAINFYNFRVFEIDRIEIMNIAKNIKQDFY